MSASDVRVKKVAVELDKPRHLCYDMNAFADLEEKFGSVQKAFDALKSEKLSAVRYILWAGLTHEDDKLTERGVGKLFTLGDIPALVRPMMDAITSSLPKADEAKNE
ncbi:hypothetical protein [Alicyclobacillus dauci]|uniref:Uncharacterized protein n=1 Tax=Alicyclobacillus dauci TaxID=1475485 RepID=A0ABY6Z793_9BACL|nr:hypothetical protein [Alicyclobacillus dauci]WAH38620.1 hypothetical protein NZD86_09120 [Alicyclobacillus dauci]